MISHSIFKDLRVLNTRPVDQAASLSQIIEAGGGQSINIPTLSIDAIPPQNWLSNLPILSSIQQSIFTSPNAAQYFFNALREACIDWPKTIQVIAIGKGTTKVLSDYHVTVNCCPDQSDSEHIIALPSLQSIKNMPILLIKGEGGRTIIHDAILLRGGLPHIVNTYRRSMPRNNKKQLMRLWQIDGIDMIVFTSEEAMRNLFCLLDKEAHRWLQEKPCVVLSERLAKGAEALGINKTHVITDLLIAPAFKHQG
ncbi:MAG: uroporphyrinogen-III synthase [Enhydrobacter sp.]